MTGIGKSSGATKITVSQEPITCGACGYIIGEIDQSRIIRKSAADIGTVRRRMWVVYKCDNCDHVMHFIVVEVVNK